MAAATLEDIQNGRVDFNWNFSEDVKKHPRDYKEDKADPAYYLRASTAASKWRWHWSQFEDFKGYDPWHPEKPHAKQQAFHSLCDRIRDEDEDISFAGFIGGVGSGKSLTGSAEMIKWLIKYPGITGIMATPSYKVLTQSTLPAFKQLVDPLAIHNFNKGEMVMEFTNGSTLYFRSTTREDLLRGINASVLHLDEGAFAPSRAWDILVGRLRQVGYPHGGFVTTTPNGHNWLFQRFASEERPEGYDYVKVSAEDNPWLNPEFILNLKRTYGDSQFADQEIHGEFVLLSGLVYPDFSWDTHVIDLEYLGDQTWLDKSNDRRFKPKRVLYLVDWGYSNPLVCLLCLVDSDGRMVIADEYYKSGMLAEEMGQWVWQNWVPEHGKGMMVCDPSEPDEIVKMARLGFNSRGGENPIMTGIQEITSRLQIQEDGLPRLLVSGGCEDWLREVRSYVYPEKKEGKAASENPVDEHNHALDATRYGAMELRMPTGMRRLNNSDLDLVI